MIQLQATIMFLVFIFNLPALSAWEQSGKFTLGYQSFYKQPTLTPTNFQKSGPSAVVEPSLQWSNQSSRVKIKALLGYDQSFSQSSDKSVGIPEELFWETRKGRNNWIVGINTFNWGITDIVNPLDVLNTRSYRNLLNPQKIGSPSITWSHSRDRWSLEFVYIPVQIPSQLPGEGSRFFPQGASLEKFAAQNDATTTIRLPEEGIRYHIQKAELYEEPFKNNLGIKFRTSTDNLEAHFIGFEGHPGLPNFDPRPALDPYDLTPPNFIFTLNPDFDIVPQYYRIRVGGLGLVYSTSSWIFKLAHAQVWQTKQNFNQNRAGVELITSQPKTTVLAMERPISIGSLENTLLLQGVLQSDPNQATESTLSTRAIYDGSITVGWRMASSLDWSATLGILANPKEKVQIYSYDFSYRLNDHNQLQLTGQHLAGKQGSLINSMEFASNANLNLISSW